MHKISIFKCSEKGRLEMTFISIFLNFDERRLSLYLKLPSLPPKDEFLVFRVSRSQRQEIKAPGRGWKVWTHTVKHLR
jgi:hypothetical protein